jgi:hypothetical protein
VQRRLQTRWRELLSFGAVAAQVGGGYYIKKNYSLIHFDELSQDLFYVK